MSRKHPQNGPSFSKATYKQKPLTDKELAERQAKVAAREAEVIERSRAGRAFSEMIKRSGGTLQVRGPGVSKFWEEPAKGEAAEVTGEMPAAKRGRKRPL